MMVSYGAADAADAKRVFAALAEGGNVTRIAADLLLRGVRHVRRPVRHAVDGRRPGSSSLLDTDGGPASR